jgi:hypothetical protein
MPLKQPSLPRSNPFISGRPTPKFSLMHVVPFHYAETLEATRAFRFFPSGVIERAASPRGEGAEGG